MKTMINGIGISAVTPMLPGSTDQRITDTQWLRERGAAVSFDAYVDGVMRSSTFTALRGPRPRLSTG